MKKILSARLLAKGRAAIFVGCGLGKTLIQLEWAQVIFNELIEHIPPLVVYKIAKTQNGCHIYFNNGKFIRFVRLNDGARGYRFNKSFIETGIDVDTLNMVILPMIVPLSGVTDCCCFVADNVGDIIGETFSYLKYHT